MSTAPVLYKEVIRFCEYHIGRGCFSAFTSTDWKAWKAFVYLVELYGSSSYRETVLIAMRATLHCAQNRDDIHTLFVQAIPAVLDWSDAAKIWTELKSDWTVAPFRRRKQVR